MRLHNNTHYKATLIQFKLLDRDISREKMTEMLSRHFTDTFCSTSNTLLLFSQSTSTLSPHQWSVITPYIIFEKNPLERCITFRSCCNNHMQHGLNFLRNKRKCLRSITGFEALSRHHTYETASFRRQACLTLMLNVKYPIYVQ